MKNFTRFIFIKTVFLFLFFFSYSQNYLQAEERPTLANVFAHQWIVMPLGPKNETFIDDDPLGYLQFKEKNYVFQTTGIQDQRIKDRLPFFLQNTKGEVYCRFSQKSWQKIYVFELKKDSVVATCVFSTDPKKEAFQVLYKPDTSVSLSRFYLQPLQKSFSSFEIFNEVNP